MREEWSQYIGTFFMLQPTISLMEKKGEQFIVCGRIQAIQNVNYLAITKEIWNEKLSAAG